MTEPEDPLVGGNMDAQVVRIGHTVRRRSGPWTPSVNRLLAHLADNDFAGAPRPLGYDEQGREVLTFMAGDVVWPDHFELVMKGDSLVEIGQLIRRLHDLTGRFVVDVSDEWRDEGRDRDGPPEVVCHNDLAAWNLVRTTGGWAFIDWDLAAPGRRWWDLSWSAYSLVPLWPDSELDDISISQRLTQLCDGYGVAREQRSAVLAAALERADRMARELRVRGAAGEQPWARLVEAGHLDRWSRGSRHLERRLPVWQRMISTLPDRRG